MGILVTGGAGIRKTTVQWYLGNQGWVEAMQTAAYRDWVEQNHSQRTA